MALTGPQLRALIDGHALAEARERQSAMVALRAAFHASAEDFERIAEEIGGAGAGDDRADWLEGWDG